MRREAAVLVLAALVSGCRAQGEKPGFVVMPGMQYSVPYDAYDRNPVTASGQTLLLPPEGTVPLANAAFLYGPGPEEAERAGRELRNLLPPSAENLARGRQVFENVCAVCHGPGGQGDGPIIGRFPNPPSLLAARVKGLPDGLIVHVVSRGQGIMPSHAAQVLLEDRWRVVLHLRQLQGADTPSAGAGAPSPSPAPSAAAGAPR